MRTLVKMIAAAGVVAMLAACNTVQGFGRDLQGGGAALSETAEDVQDGT